MILSLTPLQSPNPASNLLSQAIEATEAQSHPLRHALLHHVHHILVLDHWTNRCQQIHGQAAKYSDGPLTTYGAEQQRHN